MSKQEKTAYPQLRLAQFKDAPAWRVDRLGHVSIPVDKRAGRKVYTLLSVTSGVGLVPQIEKFGREIAGSAYKSYYVIREYDFAYNRSATKQFPEGYISMLVGYDEAALPNSIFTCFRIVDKECDPRFFDYLFQTNYHGSWLRKYIEIGARAHGALNVDTKHLWDMPIALPTLAEQQKIADCLFSIDELIALEGKKLAEFETHKKGLLQKLLPAEGKTVPEWRFPEFRDSGAWKRARLSDLADKITDRNKGNLYSRVFTNSATSGVVDQRSYFDRDIVTKSNLGSYLIIDAGDYVYNPRISAASPVGPISKNKVAKGIISPLYTVFRFRDSDNAYFEHYFQTNMWHPYIKRLSNTGARHDRMNITTEAFFNMPILYPQSKAEQQKISSCLSSVDELIAVQTENIAALKAHKKGLMQGLFPSIEEVSK